MFHGCYNGFFPADTMKNMKFPSLPLRLFEYLTTLGLGSLAATVIIRYNLPHSPLFVMTVIAPSCLIALFIIFSAITISEFLLLQSFGIAWQNPPIQRGSGLTSQASLVPSQPVTQTLN
jgi:hypothetical protein